MKADEYLNIHNGIFFCKTLSEVKILNPIYRVQQTQLDVQVHLMNYELLRYACILH